MSFANSQHVYIVGMEFVGCGRPSNRVINVDNFVLRDSKFQGQGNSGTALELIGTTAEIFNCRFLSNRRGKYIQFWETIQVYGNVGGAILASNSRVNISQSHFEGSAAQYGGAMYVERGSVIHIKNSMFIQNNGTRNGGGVVYSYISNITIEASTFRYNTATSGGVLQPWYCNITIKNSHFDNSTSTSAGGVAYIHFSNMAIKSSNFTNTYAGFSGGVIYTGSSNVTIESSVFENNTGRAGGALITSRATIIMKSSRFYRNTASPSNGGVMDNIGSNVTIIASEFVDNHTPDSGGALYARSGTDLTVENSRFTNNVASNGGAMYSTSSNIRIIACNFANMATGYGNGLCASASTVTIRETSAFVSISPDYRAGILYSSGSTITIEEPVTTTGHGQELATTTTVPMVADESTTSAMSLTTALTEAESTTLGVTGREMFTSTSITMGTDESVTIVTVKNTTTTNAEGICMLKINLAQHH